MAQVKYIGIHDEVELTLPSGARVVVKQGQAVETTAEHAGALVSTTSDMWQHLKPATQKTSKRATTTKPAAAADSAKELI